ncbi:MAG TPA: SCO family protein [Ktedonobacteraceae bacterium]|jgi:protein SCO1/2|nr:SCO family protein [Ktedonobacteraceae bacterium]
MMNNTRRSTAIFHIFAVLMLAVLFAGCASTTQSNMSNMSNMNSGQTQSSSNSQGTDLGKVAAPNFQLKDQHNIPIALTQFKGKPLILTFFYTHCQTSCPLIAEKIHSTLLDLGKNSQQVGIVAISADPTGDTPASVATFSQEHQLQGYKNWHYLLGTRQQLSPIWASYHVDGVPPHATMMSAGNMAHSSVVYVIDQQGHERTLFDSDFQPNQLAQNIQTLLTNKS